MKIPVFKPYLDNNEVQASKNAIELGWLGPGSYVCEFEQNVAKFINVDPDCVIAVNTGTSAVHLALKSCDVGINDEVITPSFNNIADFQAIKTLHANPVFCDIKEDSLTMDPDGIVDLISNKTKAIICLDFGAALCDFEKIKSIADRHNIPLIYDAAHCFGSSNYGQKVGEFSDICTFSFDPVKNLTCIDGGIVILKNREQALKLRHMRMLGQKQDQNKLYSNDRSWTYDVDDIGYRYHLANLHAAIGLEQLKKFPEIARKRKELFQFYQNELSDIPGLTLPQKIDENVVPFIFVIRVLNNKRTEFRKFLDDNFVDTGIHWQPGHLFSLFKDCKMNNLNITNIISNEIVTIPFYPGLTEEEGIKVTQVIKLFFKK
ncbi:DegT/DnrJ/EryC1/StrS family aminotransferase [Fluviispira multicolorata]|uniref:Aminotransferase class V-fold PLP-dependent enzyme n=1 Tax=Fluviispira multicolorata TaxID=2654512 RepID=A0A833N068_9BACT|nr:DegT/DnrJ/EryC1/StrS family aminotransferase [Fluviispira multicolorata]KAB8028043.1 aminotransferase class V-fold PLP-dependent enzyme [Fluviispira multicolorata]